MKVFLNHALYEPEDAKISIYDRSFREGVGLEERFLCLGGKFYALEAQLQRMQERAAELHLPFEWDINDIKEALAATYEMNHWTEKVALLRCMLTSGGSFSRLVSEAVEKNTKSTSSKRVSKKKREDEKEDSADEKLETKEEPAGEQNTSQSISISPSLAITIESLPYAWKTVTAVGKAEILNDVMFSGTVLEHERHWLSKVGTYVACLKAESAGASVGLIVDAEENLTGCTHGEVFTLRDQFVFCSPNQERGVFTPLLQKIFAKMDLSLSEEGLKTRDLKAADAIFCIDDIGQVSKIDSFAKTAKTKSEDLLLEIAQHLGDSIQRNARLPF